MHWQFWGHTDTKEMPKTVRAALARDFRLDDQATATWRYFDQNGKFAGRPVRFFKIVDPDLIDKGAKTPVKYRDLEPPIYKSAVQFEGYIEREGYVILKDRRLKQPVAQ